MNKGALIGKLFFLAIIVIIIMGATVYLTFSKGGVKLRTGDIVLSVDYEPEEAEEGKIFEIDEDGNIVPEDIEESEDIEEVGVNGSLLNVTENNNTW